MLFFYQTDGTAIYRQSFATIRAILRHPAPNAMFIGGRLNAAPIDTVQWSVER